MHVELVLCRWLHEFLLPSITHRNILKLRNNACHLNQQSVIERWLPSEFGGVLFVGRKSKVGGYLWRLQPHVSTCLCSGQSRLLLLAIASALSIMSTSAGDVEFVALPDIRESGSSKSKCCNLPVIQNYQKPGVIAALMLTRSSLLYNFSHISLHNL